MSVAALPGNDHLKARSHPPYVYLRTFVSIFNFARSTPFFKINMIMIVVQRIDQGREVRCKINP